MAVFATDSQRVSNLVKHEYEPSLDYCRKVLTFTGTTAFGLGTVLGKVTSTGAYVEAVETANDGSKAPAAVVLEDKEQAEKLFKAVKGLAAEDFQAVVEVVKALTAKVDANGFFTETGAKTADITKAAGDPVAEALKARLQKYNQE